MRPTSALPWLASYADGVPATITPPDEPLTDSLYRAAERFPDRVAVDFEGKATTYRELLDEVERAAGALLALGVQHGDRVAIALPNCHTHVVAFWAVLRLGAIVVEHNPTYSAVELEHQLADSGAVAAICWEPTAARVAEVQQNTQLRHLIAVDLTRDLPRAKRLALTLPVPAARKQRAALRGLTPAGALEWHRLVADAKPVPAAHPAASAADVATIQYTGGTTGTPKGAVLTHRTLGSNAVQGVAWTQFKDGTETIYGVLPFFHAFGLTLCLTFAARIGATLVAFGKFDPANVLAAQRRRPATFLPGVAPMFDRLSALAEKTGADLSTIRISLAGAMPISRATAERWEKLTGGLLIEGYGLTETGPVALGNPCTADRRPGALGLPFPSTEIRVVDQDDPTVDVEPGQRGELLIRGPQVFSGYWNRPSENADQLLPDGWLRTGDVVVVDEHGFATLVDRIKEMIVTGGFKVYPSQVEGHLRSMPGVADVAVVGIPGGDMGEKVVAAVVLDASASLNIDLAAVREWCGQRLARYAVPRELVIVADLPRSQIGKVLRRVVREQVLARA